MSKLGNFRMLFNHCEWAALNYIYFISDTDYKLVSDSIAWIMVAFDHGFNGYRDIVLPLAYQDELVQRAVSVTAAFHLAHREPGLLPHAESGRAAIIAKLRFNAMNEGADKVFNLSTWITIILLLVGETITGSTEFPQLFAMLATMLKQENLSESIPPNTYHFILQQTKMCVPISSIPEIITTTNLSSSQHRFQLFTPPLLDMSQGLETLKGDLSTYTDHLFQFPTTPSTPASISHSISIIQTAIHITRTIYLQQALHDVPPSALSGSLELLRQTVLPITVDTPGMHTLVWVYFVAAASTSESRHRMFFADRLVEVWGRTRMGSIVVALQRLERIWEVQRESGGWVRNLGVVDPVLII